MTTSFAAAVDEWVQQTKARAEVVFHESAQRVVSEMQEPGPSKATVKKAIAGAVGLKGKGKKAARVGPIPNPGGSGNLPVDTGFLRASLIASTSIMPTIREGNVGEDGKSYQYTEDQIALVIAGADLGQTLYLGYTAAYARHIHYGTKKGVTGRQWVTLAAQRWPQIVAQVTAEARAASA